MKSIITRMTNLYPERLLTIERLSSFSPSRYNESFFPSRATISDYLVLRSEPQMFAAYRAQAALRFRRHLEQVAVHSNAPCNSTRQGQLQPYTRASFPALHKYLSKAAAAYARFKQSPASLCTPIAVIGSSPQKLGHGPPCPILCLFAHKRREKWNIELSQRTHFARAKHSATRDVVLPCKIPIDIRRMAHSHYNAYCSRKSIDSDKPPQALGHKLGILLGDDLIAERPLTRTTAYIIHVTRCRKIYYDGNAVLPCASLQARQTMCDTFEQVLRIYASKPDELYRRKTARKFARWRRKRRELEIERLADEANAENEMKRRRGHDQLLTTREARDSSFAPFLFQSKSHAYAYSTKITKAPALRKAMIEKYSTSNAALVPDQWELAQRKAETMPLFHTRVMNRFS